MLKLLKKYRAQLGDSVWSILGLVLMNAVAQVLLFPQISRVLGEDGYGNVQYLIAYINIITVSVGCAANLARMTAPKEERIRDNGSYNLFLFAVSLLGAPLCYLVCRFGGVEVDTPTKITYYLLFVSMAFRYYADVIFKITLNYRRYFLYYLVVAVGYGVGAVLFHFTHVWPLTLLPGEVLGVVFAFLCNREFRKGAFRPSPAFWRVLRGILILTVSEGISNLIFNADRLILKWFVDASAVTVYYLATLVGKTASLVVTPLNGVLIGYLARYDGRLTRKMMRIITLCCLGAFVLFTGVCALGGLLALYILYPQSLAQVRPFLLIGSFGQVLFFVTGTVTVVLIRFAKKSYQVIINTVFGVLFLGLGIPATIFFGVWGFATAMVIASLVRFLTAIFLGFRWARLGEREAVA